MDAPRYLTADEAARELGVKRETLYAYVSRGLVRSEPGPGGRRARRYHAEDVRALLARKQRGRSPRAAVEGALDWGTPVLESGLTLITERALYYRGRDVVRLAAERTLEEVALLLWTGSDPASGPARVARAGSDARPAGIVGTPGTRTGQALATVARLAGLEPAHRMMAALPLLAAADPAAARIASERVVATGLALLPALAAAAAGVDHAPAAHAVRVLAAAWAPGVAGAERLLEAAAILCADHELNTSTLAARCAASTWASPYGVVAAGLATLHGTRHGGASGRARAMLVEAGGLPDPAGVVRARLGRGEDVPGFGHPLYPDGDPRASSLLGWLREAREGRSPALDVADAVAREAERVLGLRPNVDFALAALAHALALPQGAELALFALGRTTGWIAHALEQYPRAQIRPRARYAGPPPEPS
ncbi:MAG TPA: citrate synthase family protein [Longimicrobiales bacterium]|nr:citrate synthase family protein [Longimicrobiales bacterium]